MDRFPHLFDSPVQAGHTAKGKFRVYGEGSVSHPTIADCMKHCGFNRARAMKRHPWIVRTDYASRWAFYRREIARWLELRSMRHWRVDRETNTLTIPRPVRPIWTHLFGHGWPDQSQVYGPIRPEESIYDRSDEIGAVAA